MPVPMPYKPESAAVRPAAIKECANGQIPMSLMASCGIRSFVLVEPAARAMRAMVKAALRDDIHLSATGTYRSFDGQVSLFQSRYCTPPKPGATDIRTWQGKQWGRYRGAGAAVPGTSNHGTGLAVDLARFDAAGHTVTLDQRTLDWLCINGPKFGWHPTVQSENWHWCYTLGDKVSPAVIAEEAQTNPASTPPPQRSATHPTLRQGAEGLEVATMQTLLRAKGFDPGNPDGKFGPRTDKALRAFQAANKLTVDGICGDRTWAVLAG